MPRGPLHEGSSSPQHWSSPGSPRAEWQSNSPPPPDRYPIVVVEDDGAIRLLVHRALASEGYPVSVVGAGEEALCRLADLSSPVLVVDKNLPGMSGLDLVSRLRDVRDDFEAVMMTADADVDSVVRCLELGVFQYIRKPFELSEIHAAVAGAANRLFLRMDRRAQTAELERRNRQLEGALSKLKSSESKRLLSERLASIGQFASSLAHEINNPLAYVHTNVGLLREGVGTLVRAMRTLEDGNPAGLDPRTRHDAIQYARELEGMLEECATGLTMMRQISQDLRSVSRYRTDSRERFDVNQVIRTACRVARVEPRLQAHLRLELHPEELPIEGSPGRMAQVVMNLVANAAESTDVARDNHVVVRSFPLQETAIIEVADTGVGIEPERLTHIFEPFVTSRGDDSGTGIGLGIVRQIVEEHGGTVEVDSTVGVGSTFRVVVPRVQRRTASSRVAAMRRFIPEGVNLLFVDDDPLVRRAMARAFPKDQVRFADNGRTALERIEEARPDVIVSDLRMPEMDGLTLYERVAERWPDLADKILFVSGSDGIADRARDQAPERPLLRKPFNFRELAEKIVDASETAAFEELRRA